MMLTGGIHDDAMICVLGTMVKSSVRRELKDLWEAGVCLGG